MSTVNESGLYTLIFRSNKPQAKPFRRWVTHEVLPTIRKTGSYSVSAQLPGVHLDKNGIQYLLSEMRNLVYREAGHAVKSYHERRKSMHAGERTPQHVIDKMKAMALEGKLPYQIVEETGFGRTTVKKYTTEERKTYKMRERMRLIESVFSGREEK